MKSKQQWLIAWAAASMLWVLYWIGMTLALGVDAIREMVAEMSWPYLVGALYASIPLGLYAIGSLIAWMVRMLGKDRP